MFRTSDLYVAAGLVIASGIHPDKMDIQGGIVYCEFNDPGLELFIAKLNAGDLRVDVRALRIEHIDLKKRVFEIVDKKGLNHETAPH
jgi:hypothetical protein